LKNNPSAAVEVDGHCDERGTDEYNRALGERRALAVREALVTDGIAGVSSFCSRPRTRNNPPLRALVPPRGSKSCRAVFFSLFSRGSNRA
jgi:hypothetical protein